MDNFGTLLVNVHGFAKLTPTNDLLAMKLAIRIKRQHPIALTKTCFSRTNG
jgi:hypothetical protein